jgi:alcohol dehydrogenase class IV
MTPPPLRPPVRFEFATAGRILFGAGTAREVGILAATLGRRALVVTGRHPERVGRVLAGLTEKGVVAESFPVAGEPTTRQVAEGVNVARRAQCELVIAVGGGSAIDAAKAIGALLTNEGDLFDYLEVIGKAQPLTRPSVPVVAVPTTAGTGCEVTRNAVLASPEHRFKISLRSPFLLPRLAVVDPELTLDLPREITASSGLDALTQLMEPFVSPRANPMTDSLCREGIQRAARSLRQAWQNPADLAAREDMALASLFSGLALANAGLGAVHGLAAPLGGMFAAPHGALCAALLPHVMETNLRALRGRSPSNPALERYGEVARMLTGRAEATPEDGAHWARKICAELGIPPLRAYGLTLASVPDLVEKSIQASSMKANPVALTREELAEVIQQAL